MRFTIVLLMSLVATTARADDGAVTARLDALIADLGSDAFETRDAALRELAKLTWERADLARAHLPLKIAGAKSMDVRKRLESFLAAASGGRWRALPAAPIATRYGDARLVLPDGRILIWGGFSFLDREPKLYADGAIFDPKTFTWTKIADAPIAARTGATALVVGERVLVIGGVRRVWAALDGEAPRDCAWYDMKNDAWTTGPDLPLPELNAATIGVGIGRVIVFGHVRGKSEYAGAAFDPAKNVWTTLAKFPLSNRSGAAQVWTGRHLVVWGGQSEDGPAHGDGAVWDVETGVWSALPDVGVVGRFGSHALRLGGRAIVLGGTSSTGEVARERRDGFALEVAKGEVTSLRAAAHRVDRVTVLGPLVLAVSREYASVLDPTSGRWSPPIIEGEGEAVLHAGMVAGQPLFLVSDGTARRFDLERFRWLPTTAAPEGATRHVPTFHRDGLFLWGGGDVPTSGRLSPGRMFDGGFWYEPPPK